MSRIIYTNGCSWTYGTELEDRSNAWPYLVGRKLNVPVHNYAEPGSTNDSIVRRTVRDCEQLVQQGMEPTVIIAWTHLHRFELPIAASQGEHYYNFVSPKDKDTPAVGQEIWQNWSSEQSDRARFELQKKLLSAYLAQLNITFYFFNTFRSTGPNSFETLTLGYEQGPFRHPLDKAHTKISEYVLTKIN